MEDLQHAGLITLDELTAFVGDGSFIGDQDLMDRAHRFPSGADPDQRWKIALCKAAIGQKWANADVVWGLGLAGNTPGAVITADMAKAWYYRPA